MNRTLLFGWDSPAWERAIAWARSDLKPSDMFDESKFPALLAIRTKWLKCGGPESGPITQLLGVAA